MSEVRLTWDLGTAKSALDVLGGVASEYLLNVGRTIKLLSDKFANKMTPEVSIPLFRNVYLILIPCQEIILHTLFESGTTKIQNLERYIKDDVVRYGSRLGDLEKKLVGAYREAVSPYSHSFMNYLLIIDFILQTAVEALDDDALFGNEEDEEEDGAFVMYVIFRFSKNPFRLSDGHFPGVILQMLWATISWVFGN